MEFPITVNEIKWDMDGSSIKNDGWRKEDIGSWVSVRPVKDSKTYLGIFLGDHHDPCLAFNKETNTLIVKNYPLGNPALFIPELKKVILGRECWWGIIKSADDLRQITNIDIQNVWYVKAMKDLTQ